MCVRGNEKSVSEGERRGGEIEPHNKRQTDGSPHTTCCRERGREGGRKEREIDGKKELLPGFFLSIVW